MPRLILLPIAATACALALLACGAGAPSDDEVRRALADKSRALAKGCVGFTDLPGGALPAAEVNGYAAYLPTLVQIGLLEKTGTGAGPGYRLTRAGQASFDPARKGFCYNSGYTAQHIKVEKTDNKAALANTPLTAGYYVSFDRVPTDPQAWIRDPSLQPQLSGWRAEDFGTQHYTAHFVRQGDGQPLQVDGYSFNLPPSLDFSRGF